MYVYTIQVNDRNDFLRKARDEHLAVHVSSAHVVVPDAAGMQRPALLLQYRIQFAVPDGQTSWIFKELAEANDGRVNLQGTLLEELQNPKNGQNKLDYQFAARSGSL